VNLWQSKGDDSFKTDPPNVALSFDNKTLIATMTDPKIVKTRDGGQAFASTMTLIGKDAVTRVSKNNEKLGAHAKRAGENNHSGAKTLRSVSVFVDSEQVGTGCTLFNCHMVRTIIGNECLC
jgi:hypothetical protein